jgi:glycosyltransferase involved in cell wall biosynthesis
MVEEGGVGGVAEYTAELTAALARAGWSVDVATALDHAYPPAPGVTVHRLFPYVRGGGALVRGLRRLRLSTPVNGVTHLAANAPLLRIARRCDVVHVQGGEWPPLGAVQTLLVRAAGRPQVWTPHNTFDRGDRSYARSRGVSERGSARLVVHSEHDRALLARAVADKTVVIPHGEYGGLARRGGPNADPAAARAELGLPPDATVALLFGQLRPDKGVRDLLEAAREVPAVHVVLAGQDHGALAQVGDLLDDPALRGRVVVRDGFVPTEQVGRLFAAADVAALPYHRASASGVLLLAYGYARPVVAYPTGGLPEYVEDGVTGWLCAAATPAALADRLREIVGAGAELLRARGATAQQRSNERFGWDPIARRTGELYRSLGSLPARRAGA